MYKLLLILLLFSAAGAEGQTPMSKLLRKHVSAGGGGAYQTESQKFFDSVGGLSTGEKNAYDSFVVRGKRNGWWPTGYGGIYVYAGTTATQHKYNLFDAATFPLTFTGTYTHGANYADPDGTTAYANTGISYNTLLTGTGFTVAFYTPENEKKVGALSADIGAEKTIGSPSGDILLSSHLGDGNDWIFGRGFPYTPSLLQTGNTNTSGFYAMTRHDNGSTGNLVLYKGATQQQTATVSTALPASAYTLFINAENVNNASATFYSPRKHLVSIIMPYIDATKEAALSGDVSSLKTDLGL